MHPVIYQMGNGGYLNNDRCSSLQHFLLLAKLIMKLNSDSDQGVVKWLCPETLHLNYEVRFFTFICHVSSEADPRVWSPTIPLNSLLSLQHLRHNEGPLCKGQMVRSWPPGWSVTKAIGEDGGIWEGRQNGRISCTSLGHDPWPLRNFSAPEGSHCLNTIWPHPNIPPCLSAGCLDFFFFFFIVHGIYS